MAQVKKPGIAKRTKPQRPKLDSPKVKATGEEGGRVVPLSRAEFHALVYGKPYEHPYWAKALLWLGAKLISAGLLCYRLTD